MKVESSNAQRCDVMKNHKRKVLFAAIIVIMYIYLCFSNLSNCSSSGSVTPFLYVYPIFR